jgi:hypothetical protein
MKKLLCIFAFLAFGGSCFAEPFRIVAYGDSITFRDRKETDGTNLFC